MRRSHDSGDDWRPPDGGGGEMDIAAAPCDLSAQRCKRGDR